ncbi:MAG TPA: hypothetical protein VFC86_10730, partial [Planctomycetota bacterium]|nr:hypothetical protein [Planctomycetota bacterium]
GAAKTSERAKEALAEVRAHLKFGDAYPPVRTFSISLKDRPFEEALKGLGAALGVPIEPPPKPAPGMPDTRPERISLELRDAYFLEAMDRFSVASGCSLWLQEGVIKCSPYSMGPGLRYYWRGCVLWPDSLNEERVVTAQGSKKTTHLEIRLAVDGAARWAGIKGVRVFEARDDTGRDLALEKQDNWWGFRDFMPGTTYPFPVALKEPASGATSLVRVRGAIDFQLPQEPYFVELDLAPGVGELKAEGISVRAEVKPAGDVHVTCTILQLDKPHLRPRPSDFHLKSADGKMEEGIKTPAGPPNAPVLQWKIAGPAGFKAAKLRIRFFKSFGEISVPFDIERVPIR